MSSRRGFETAVQCANRVCEEERLRLLAECEQLILKCREELILMEMMGDNQASS